MLLTIAIISLIGFIFGILFDFHLQKHTASPRMCLSAIMVLSWWNICLPFAIILLVVVGLWALIALGTMKKIENPQTILDLLNQQMVEQYLAGNR